MYITSKMKEQDRQIKAYTGSDKQTRTYFRDKDGNIAVIRGTVNPSIRLHTDESRGWTREWTVTSLTPLENSAVIFGLPVMEIKSEGLKCLRENDNGDATADTIGWYHGGVIVV
jgi:hypothetical protein